MAVIGHAKASVTAPGGATSPMSWLMAASSGARHSPAITANGTMTAIEGASSSGTEHSG